MTKYVGYNTCGECGKEVPTYIGYNDKKEMQATAICEDCQVETVSILKEKEPNEFLD